LVKEVNSRIKNDSKWKENNIANGVGWIYNVAKIILYNNIILKIEVKYCKNDIDLERNIAYTANVGIFSEGRFLQKRSKEI
jgi:hypothetical protein